MPRLTPTLLAGLAAALLAATTALANPLWIDVRSPEEYSEGHIAGDPNVPHSEIAARIAALTSARDTEIVLYCARGGRSGTAQKTLEALGYTQVRNGGGIDDVRKERGLE